MAIIHVPRAPKSAWNPNRPMSTLLLWQVEQLQDAELRLPLHHQTGIYVNAIKTEGEAAEYIAAVTKAIHDAHEEVEGRRAKRVPPKSKPVIEIAAAPDTATERKRTGARPGKGKAKKTKSSAKPKRKR